MWLLANGPVSFSDGACAFSMGRCHFLTGRVLFWEKDLVFFGLERVNPLCYGRDKPVYVVPVGICLFVVCGFKTKKTGVDSKPPRKNKKSATSRLNSETVTIHQYWFNKTKQHTHTV